MAFTRRRCRPLNQKPLGDLVERTQRTRVAAYGLILDQDNILLSRLSSAIPNHQGKWTLPGGGIEFGESPATAMVREVQEETGLKVEPRGVADVDSITFQQDQLSHHSIRLIYHASILGGQLKHEINGTTDLCKWWHKSECPDMVDLAQKGVAIAFSSHHTGQTA